MNLCRQPSNEEISMDPTFEIPSRPNCDKKLKDMEEEELFLDMAEYLRDGMDSDSSYDPSCSHAVQESPPAVFRPQPQTSAEPIRDFLAAACHPSMVKQEPFVSMVKEPFAQSIAMEKDEQLNMYVPQPAGVDMSSSLMWNHSMVPMFQHSHYHGSANTLSSCYD